MRPPYFERESVGNPYLTERMLLMATSLLPAKSNGFRVATKIAPFQCKNYLSRLSLLFSKSNLWKDGSACLIACTGKDNADDLFEDFSGLPLELPWDANDTWSTFAAYFFSLHVPLSFGGLSVVAQILHKPILDPLTTVISAILLQTTEYVGLLAFLHYTLKPQYNLSSFFLEKLFSERNWIKASALGIVILLGLVLLTSIVADMLIGSKDVNNPILKEILLYSPTSNTACFILYCFITPLLEETVYRGFLLTSLASRMKWWQAVIISSFIFSLAHFSGENSLQLFLIGCVLGSAYCWSGNIASSFTIHSVYNALVLLVTIMA